MTRKKIFKSAVSCLALIVICFSGLSAQITIQNIDWQVSKARGTKRLPFVGMKKVLIKPKSKISEKIRILVSVLNEGDKIVEGLVLRYSLNFRIVKLNSADDTAIWSVPFRIEELRISKICPSCSQTVKIINTGISNELKKLKNNGFWIDAIGMEIMIEPRKGDDLTKNIHQSLITAE
ncbi:MAG: hypothetical protein L6420_05935 [Elusimicrobia bacterium]|nr:hypothetical protein [Elusimicrobiota bacterium]